MLHLNIVGIIIAIVLIISVSIYSSKTNKKQKGASSWVVAGGIMGTLVGGSSTVGTAQLAYQYGMSAWWFTLGGGIACLVLALFYAKPFHKSGNKTLAAFITNEYGKKIGLLSSVFSSFGSFINIISQLIAASAIIAVVFPSLNLAVAIAFSAVIMILYVIFGGTKGSGIVGILKMVLLYLTMIAVGVLVLVFSNGLTGFFDLVKGIDNPENVRFFSLFARGINLDVGACLSLILGVITTQSYAQAIFMADKTDNAVKGALLSAVLIPPVGIGGILVGLYMRALHPEIVSKIALTYFVTEYMPPLLGGIVLGTLFIAVVGTGAGLALGISTCLTNDVVLTLSPSKGAYKKPLEKAFIVAVLLVASLLSVGPLGDTILSFSFMSMGLRGATIFIPLFCAIWLSDRIPKLYAGLSVIAGPVTVLIFNLVDVLPVDPLFVGVFVSAMIVLVGYMHKRSLCERRKI